MAEPVGRKYLCRVRERQTAPNAAFIFMIVLYSGEGNRGIARVEDGVDLIGAPKKQERGP